MSQPPMISIVDDDPGVRQGIARLMRSFGYLTRTFASAEEFPGLVRTGETDCLITDIQMPGLSGLDLQRAIAGRGELLPIIFVTAYAAGPFRGEALSAGAICVLSKPFDGELLAGCVARALDVAFDRGDETPFNA